MARSMRGTSGGTLAGWVILAACLGILLGTSRPTLAMEPTSEPTTIPLWPEGVPGSRGTDPDKDVPTLTIWRPRAEVATDSAVVVCPGGGYGMLAMGHEGKQVAEWLNSLGITAFVLKYRLGPRYHHPAMLQDAGRDPDGASGRGEMEARPAQDRDPGLLGRRAPGLDGRHTLRRRQVRRRGPDRVRQLAAGQDDPGLSGHRAGDTLRTHRVAAESARR